METRSVIVEGLEFREDSTRLSPGTISGSLLKYGETIRHERGLEVFEPRSLTWDKDHGIVLYNSHEQRERKPVGIVFPEDNGTEARFTFNLPDSPAGRRLATEVRNQKLKGLSIEFRSLSEKVVQGIRRIAKAAVSGIAAVETPAYQTASLEVRDKQDRENLLTWL